MTRPMARPGGRTVKAGALALTLGTALSGLAACGLVPQNPLDALPPAEAMAETLPESTASWMDLGLRLLEANQPVQAERAFIRSLRVEGMTAAALTGAGVAAQRQGLLTEAIRYYERAKELEPDSVAVHNNLGAALFGLGELYPARQAFKTAFALSSGTSTEAEQNLGMADLAIARAEAANPPPAENPQKLQRTGSAEYKLIVSSGTAGSG